MVSAASAFLISSWNLPGGEAEGRAEHRGGFSLSPLGARLWVRIEGQGRGSTDEGSWILAVGLNQEGRLHRIKGLRPLSPKRGSPPCPTTSPPLRGVGSVLIDPAPPILLQSSGAIR